MDYQSLDMEESDITVCDHECLLCLHGSDDDGRSTVAVQCIPHLARACKCEYQVHETCLREWLSKTPACPICKECLFYNEPPPRRRKSGNRDACGSPSVARCVHRFLCCISSPDSARND